MDPDAHFMAIALEEAEAAASRGEVPVGAALVDPSGALLARAGNRSVELSDPTAHAEVLVMRAAAQRLSNYRLTGCALYVTLEPCAMCVGAISFARLTRLVFAADDPKGGAVLHGPRFFDLPTCHHRPDVARGPGAEESAALLRSFFRARRGASIVRKTR
ncbi:MAG: nucleoside deaminase [Pseudomonadota bacterium]